MPGTSIPSLESALTDPVFAIDPYPTYEQLREAAPVYWSDAFNAWIVSRHEDVNAVLRDWRTFSNTDRITQLLAALPEEDRPRFSPLEEHFSTGMVHADPPDHTRLRRIVGYAFTNRTVEALHPRIGQIVDALMDEVIGRGHLDLIADVAYPLPATVIGELFGAPVEDADHFKRWSADLGAFQGAGRSDVAVVATATTSLVEMRRYLTELADSKRRDPGPDMLSALVGREDEPMSQAELLSFCVTMLTAGHETTTSLIGNGMLALLDDPAALAAVRDTPEMLEAAVEELLRFDAPLQRTWRRVSDDSVFREAAMSKDELVVVFLASANRDPAEFTDPDRLVFDRPTNRHVGLGTGVHFCLGAPLARLEAQIALLALLTRLPDLARASSSVSWNVSGVFRCLEKLPLTFTVASS